MKRGTLGEGENGEACGARVSRTARLGLFGRPGSDGLTRMAWLGWVEPPDSDCTGSRARIVWAD